MALNYLCEEEAVYYTEHFKDRYTDTIINANMCELELNFIPYVIPYPPFGVEDTRIHKFKLYEFLKAHALSGTQSPLQEYYCDDYVLK